MRSISAICLIAAAFIVLSCAGAAAGRTDENAGAGNNNEPHNLHVLLMSIEEYEHNNMNSADLAHDDADAIGRLFAGQTRGSLYNDVFIHQYKDKEITREGFNRIFADTASRVGRNDTFVFFFAGISLVDTRNGEFIIVPWDSAGVFENPHELNITANDILNGITSIQAKNILILLDSCESGSLLYSSDTAFERLARQRQLDRVAIITATTGDQYSLESSSLGHGVFTASILDSYNYLLEKQFLTVADMIEFVSFDVPQKAASILNEWQNIHRGFSIVDYAEYQRPMYKLPAEDFNIFDRYIEPPLTRTR